jgi:hypothetical protein
VQPSLLCGAFSGAFMGFTNFHELRLSTGEIEILEIDYC